MGRFYHGDIEGKFWFAIQSSDDASFFGGNEEEDEENRELNYFFGKDDIEGIDDGLETCIENMGICREDLDAFFEREDGWNDDMVSTAIGVDKKEVRHILQWYARYKLGLKIKACVEEKGQCAFSAEL
jgi:hypothetical protein